MKIPMLTNAMIMVANAFILGLTPRRTLEKTLIGKVVEPGPETKLPITKSSNDNVKPKSHEAVSAGKMMGRVIKKILSENNFWYASAGKYLDKDGKPTGKTLDRKKVLAKSKNTNSIDFVFS